jgi:hypothetical protein
MERISLDIIRQESFPESKFVNLSKAIIAKEDDTYIAISIDFSVAMESQNMKEAKEFLNAALIDYLETCIDDNILFYRPMTTKELEEYDIIETYDIEINHNLLEYA